MEAFEAEQNNTNAERPTSNAERRIRKDFFELSAEAVALTVIQNTYPRGHKAARSNRESVAIL
jgi:hypothetical protein